jgi:hypothetical protein
MTEAAMHRCPEHPDIEAAMLLDVIAGSASGITMR